jgi:Dynamin GTPase effector domain
MENHRPFTMNDKEYVKSQKERVTAFAVLRHGDDLPSTGSSSFRLDDTNGVSRSYSSNEDNLLRVLSAYGIHLSSSKELARIRPDEYDAELEVISHVEAYFDMSSKRLIDDIPKVFETIFARNFGLDLAKVLTTDLELVGARGLDNCQRYVRDEPDVQSTRDSLSRHLDILVKAVETVSRLFR